MSQAKVSVGIHGGSGRMGLRLIQLIGDDPALELAAALERDGHPRLGDDAGTLAGIAPMGIALSSRVAPETSVDVMIDFSTPAAALKIGEWCRERGVPLVVGTTGFDPSQRRSLEAESARIPLLISPNMSRAVNLLMKLVGEAARALAGTADIAIVERHHRTKINAPSGTALRLAEYAQRGAAAGRPGTDGPAQAGGGSGVAVNIHALRVADSPGEHLVVFGLMGETLELSHRALNRDGFARGALDAAKFLAGKTPGLYTMENVLA